MWMWSGTHVVSRTSVANIGTPSDPCVAPQRPWALRVLRILVPWCETEDR